MSRYQPTTLRQLIDDYAGGVGPPGSPEAMAAIERTRAALGISHSNDFHLGKSRPKRETESADDTVSRDAVRQAKARSTTAQRRWNGVDGGGEQ